MGLFTCKDCPNRYPGCHDKCEKYKTEKAEYERLKAKWNIDRDSRHYAAEIVTKRKSDAAVKHRKNSQYRKRYWD